MVRTIAQRLRILLRGDSRTIAEWLARRELGWVAVCLAVIVVGCGLYGATVGLWHAPRQAAYTAIKFPLLVLLTTAGNAMLNGMLAQLLGTGLSFRQTSLAILLSFTLASLIFAAFSPLTLFYLWNMPPLRSGGGFAAMQLMHVALIAFAGVVANRRLLGLIRHYAQNEMAARRTLFAWLAGNLLLGSQIAWILRPFVGKPGLPIEFVREDALRGNFFESVFITVMSALDL
jgi:hypothetical protein